MNAAQKFHTAVEVDVFDPKVITIVVRDEAYIVCDVRVTKGRGKSIMVDGNKRGEVCAVVYEYTNERGTGECLVMDAKFSASTGMEELVHEATHIGQNIVLEYAATAAKKGLEFNETDAKELGAYVTARVTVQLLKMGII